MPLIIFLGVKYFLLLVTIFTGFSPAQTGFFYSGKDYGSEAVYNPINLILNSSFDIIQLEGHSRDIFKFPFASSARNVFSNLGNPVKNINKVGWGTFLKREVFPFELTKEGAQWWPNYQLHLIGGGMTFTALKEWYAYNNFSYPAIMSALTVASYHLINEIVENNNYQGCNTDPIADIYIFDLGGMILFSFDGVNRFFSEELNLSDWSLQPSFSINTSALHNNGQYFSVKWRMPFDDNRSWHLFYYFGMNGLAGFSYKFNSGESVSIGAGLRAKNLSSVDENGRQLTVNTVWNAGFFYDRNNSLMTSLFISGLTDYTVNLNIYPGILRFGSFSPGLWTVLRKDGKFIFGITSTFMPGAAFSF